MSPTPSGQVLRTPEGRDLVLVRTFRAPIEDVWASITESERTARWFGPWTGEAGLGRTIKYSMSFEEGAPWSEMRIEACEPPRHLRVRGLGEYGVLLDVHLRETGGVTEMRFTHHLDAQFSAGDFGPGWEYYLDNLVASREGTSMPKFEDYYPAQKEYYLAQEGRAPAAR